MRDSCRTGPHPTHPSSSSAAAPPGSPPPCARRARRRRARARGRARGRRHRADGRARRLPVRPRRPPLLHQAARDRAALARAAGRRAAAAAAPLADPLAGPLHRVPAPPRRRDPQGRPGELARIWSSYLAARARPRSRGGELRGLGDDPLRPAPVRATSSAPTPRRSGESRPTDQRRLGGAADPQPLGRGGRPGRDRPRRSRPPQPDRRVPLPAPRPGPAVGSDAGADRGRPAARSGPERR